MKAMLAGLLLGFTAITANAALYRWIDPQGTVHYTDTPPPPTARNVQEKKLTPNVVENTKLPYATQEAAQKYPVILFITHCGNPCQQARTLLAKRGIPYTTQNPSDPKIAKKLKRLIGKLEVPVLVVGNAVPLTGFLSSRWNAILDAAGYPRNGTARRSQPHTYPLLTK